MSPFAINRVRAPSMLLCSGSLADCIHAQLTDGSCTEETDNKAQQRSPLLALGAGFVPKLSPLVPTWTAFQPYPCLPTYSVALDPDPGQTPDFVLTADLSVTVYLAGAHWTLAYLFTVSRPGLHPDILTWLPGVILDMPHGCALIYSDCHVAIWTLGWSWSLTFP